MKVNRLELAQQLRDIAEEFSLFGAVVQRIGRWHRVFETLVAAKIAAGEEILRVADDAAKFEAWRKRPETAAIKAETAARLECFLGGDVDDARRAQAVLRRQRAVEQADAADEAGVEHRPEPGNPQGKRNAVDSVLNVRIFVADVEIRIVQRRILGDAGRLENDLVERRVVAARQRVDRRAIQRVAASAQFRQQEAVARLIEGVDPGLRGRGRGNGGSGGAARRRRGARRDARGAPRRVLRAGLHNDVGKNHLRQNRRRFAGQKGDDDRQAPWLHQYSLPQRQQFR